MQRPTSPFDAFTEGQEIELYTEKLSKAVAKINEALKKINKAREYDRTSPIQRRYMPAFVEVELSEAPLAVVLEVVFQFRQAGWDVGYHSDTDGCWHVLVGISADYEGGF